MFTNNTRTQHQQASSCSNNYAKLTLSLLSLVASDLGDILLKTSSQGVASTLSVSLGLQVEQPSHSFKTRTI